MVLFSSSIKKIIAFLICILMFISFINANTTRTYTGFVFDKEHEPLPFVNIYIKGSTIGTTSNFDGKFILEIPQNEDVVVVFQYVGFKKQEMLIKANEEPEKKMIVLEMENYMLREVVITVKKEDPAYPIIREAIKKRKYYDEAVKSFKTKAYLKSNVKLHEIPESFFLIPKDQMPDSTQLGLVYLSESVSNYYFERPDKTKEEMIASKISGTKTGYSFNRADMAMISFYKNLISIGLSERAFISPIANNALFYYKYQLVDSFRDGDDLIHKIKVIPKRKHDNVFKGYIYIVDEKYNIHSLDLTITRHSQVDFTDSVYIRQVHVPIKEDIRMPLSLHVVMYFKVFGFKATTNFIGFFTDYEVNEDIPDEVFGSEVFTVEKGTGKQDSLYWLENRQSILTLEEKENYRKGDSVIAYHESDEYLDSLKRINNRFKPGKMLIGEGYDRVNRDRSVYYHIHSLAEAFSGFNSVEGWNMDLRQHLSKTWEKNNTHLSFNLATKYSFTTKDLTFEQNINYYFDRLHMQRISLTFGHYNYDYNNYEPLGKLKNMLRTLLLTDNFLKLYQKNFVELETSREIVNGFEAKFTAEYARRSPLVNHTTYTIIKNDQEFSSNNPQNSYDDSPAFASHNALTYGLELLFKFKQKYATYPTYRERFGTTLPILKLGFRQGVKSNFSDANFSEWMVGLYDKINLRNLGVSEYAMEFGGFIDKPEFFIDYHHFYGNRTVFIPIPKNDVEISLDDHNSEEKPVVFNSMFYYENSTRSNFLAMHYEHHFNGWVINKFPFLRNTKVQLLSGINYLHNGEGENHTEFYLGLEHIFKILRFDVVWVTNSDDEPVAKLKFGIGF